ncbi:MAG: YceI family protein [Limisphaerales bacterium]
MKIPPTPRQRGTCSAGFLALALCLGLPAMSQAQTRYSAQPRGNDVKVDGTSSLHDWEMEGTLIGGFLELGAGVQLDPAQTSIAGAQDTKIPAKARVIIPVESVHSKADHLPEVMDHLMQGAMKDDQFKTIIFTLKELNFKGPHAAGKPFEFETKGDLFIAGVTNKVAFPVTIECLDGGKIKVSGTAPVKMTDYGIPPPAPNFGLGMMKCGDAVKIIFEWTLQKRP